MLAFTPPFVEPDRIVLERYPGHYPRAVAGIVDDQAQAHEALVVVRIRAAQLADEGVEHLKLVDLQNFFPDDELMDAAANHNFNYNFLADIPLGEASRLEGFLFPDTYEFYVGMQASSAINKFLETFYYKQTADMQKALANMGIDIRTVVNMASLIEKEAANDDERRTIASVIYNRLAAHSPLGIDASILYIHPDHEGAPTGTMLDEDSPYNTRIYQGLPPTPIANPGLPSIYAVLNPEQTNYYYYALDEEAGQHRFFTHSADFNAFVATQSYGQQ